MFSFLYSSVLILFTDFFLNAMYVKIHFQFNEAISNDTGITKCKEILQL